MQKRLVARHTQNLALAQSGNKSYLPHLKQGTGLYPPMSRNGWTILFFYEHTTAGQTVLRHILAKL